ncbi:MAG: hypothetical protein ACRC6X_01160 [Culicoidibacterales bacterium]
MPKLEIRTQKKLRLENVIIKELKKIDITVIKHEITKFSNHLAVMGIKTKGPLITHNVGSQLEKSGKLTLDYNIMFQVIVPVENLGEYKFRPEIVVDNCLYLKHQAAAQNMHYAQAKIELYLYEHDLFDMGQQYIVHISPQEIDIFKPLEV